MGDDCDDLVNVDFMAGDGINGDNGVPCSVCQSAVGMAVDQVLGKAEELDGLHGYRRKRDDPGG